uniref:Protein kinase domain-containing protein n=1 Tax=Oryza meridionalis TaxID=40149 RepID=A0A0E0CF52_9ORYZ
MLRTKTPRPRGGKSRRATAAAGKEREREREREGRSPSGELSLQLEHVSLFSFLADAPREGAAAARTPFTPFEELLEGSCDPDPTPPPPLPPLQPQATPMDADEVVEEKDCGILSQDFFCTPDYITPDAPQLGSGFDANKENIPCPNSPEKSVCRSKRYKRDCSPKGLGSNDIFDSQWIAPVQFEGLDDSEEEQLKESSSHKRGSYVSQSAVALRCRVMPPPCIRNPYLNTDHQIDDNVFGGRQCKSSGFSPSVDGDGLSRYRTDFHEIEQIGRGNFSVVFKVLKRIDGCLYAVKRSIRQLHNDRERRQAVKEVQALAALGCHENIICKGLDFIHERGIAHLDVKPDNIYVRNGVYKLGDFGCATLIDRSLAIEDGDSRYMPPEMLNDKYEHLDRVDIFSLGAAIYELIRGTQLPDSGPQFSSLREGKIALLPGCPMQFQSLIKSMMDPDPMRRPSAKEVLRHPIFDKLHKAPAKK